MLVGAGLLVFTEDETCLTASARLFSQLRATERLCVHNETDVTKLEGAMFWVRLYLLQRDADWTNLTKLTGFDEKDLERTFAEDTDFSNTVATVLEGVRIGRDPGVCYSDLSP